MRPEEVKILYARVLALQSLMDGRLDPREIEYLYVFMSRVRMSSGSREEVRQTLATREASPEHVARLVEELISAVPDDQEETSVCIIKDMVIPGQYNESYSSAVAKNDGVWVQQFAAAIVRPDPEDGGFIATVPGRQDVVGRGKTEEAALEDARVALESTSESGDGKAANGAEGPEGTPRPFDARPDLAALASEQGVELADDFDALLGDFWPEGEDADKFVSALRTWRGDDIEIIEYRPETVVPRTS